MCEYFSCVLLPGGVVRWCEEDSHETLIEWLGLEDDSNLRPRFLRAEAADGQVEAFGPSAGYADLPSWYTEHQEEYRCTVASILERLNPLRQRRAALNAGHRQRWNALNEECWPRRAALEAEYQVRRDALNAEFQPRWDALHAEFQARRAALDEEYQARRDALNAEFRPRQEELVAEMAAIPGYAPHSQDLPHEEGC